MSVRRWQSKPWAILALVVAAAFLLARGNGATGPNPTAGGEATATVARVVDGDTIAVHYKGRIEKVRYIGVDTPETVKPDTPVQCYGKRASAFNRTLVAGRTVRLRFDRELRDRYGRLLAYVFVEGRFVNAELVRRGYATTMTISPNDSRAGLLRKLERRARERGRGLWSACEP